MTRPPADSEPTAEVGREFVQGIDRGFAVVRAFRPDTSSLTIAEVADLTGLTRAVARRYLFTLVKLGYVTQHGSAFALAPRILDLGYTYLATIKIPQVAPRFMAAMVEKLHEPCAVSVLDGQDIVYVARVSANRLMSINLFVGSRVPAHATSMGKVLLAYLPKARFDEYLSGNPLRSFTPRTITDPTALRQVVRVVRQRGWAATDGELEDGVRSAAVPIFDHPEQAVAAISVSVHPERVSVQELKRTYLPVLLATAAEISRALENYHPTVPASRVLRPRVAQTTRPR